MKEFGKAKVTNLKESSTSHYALREFLLTVGGVSESRKVYHYHFQVSRSGNVPHIADAATALGKGTIAFGSFPFKIRIRKSLELSVC